MSKSVRGTYRGLEAREQSAWFREMTAQCGIVPSMGVAGGEAGRLSRDRVVWVLGTWCSGQTNKEVHAHGTQTGWPSEEGSTQTWLCPLAFGNNCGRVEGAWVLTSDIGCTFPNRTMLGKQFNSSAPWLSLSPTVASTPPPGFCAAWVRNYTHGKMSGASRTLFILQFQTISKGSFVIIIAHILCATLCSNWFLWINS